MAEELDLITLQSHEGRLKDVIDDNVKDGGCSCDTTIFTWISRMVIVRKGISLDIQAAEVIGAN